MCKRLCLVLGMLVAGAGAAATTWTFTPTEKHNDNGWWYFNNPQNWRDEAGATGLPQEGDRIECLVRPDYNIAATLNDVYLSRIYFGPDNTQSVGHRGFYLKENAEAGDGFVYAPATAGAMWCSLFLDGTVTLDVQQASARLSFQAGVLGRSATRPGRFVKIGPGMVRTEDEGQVAKHLRDLRGGVIREGAFALGMRLPMKVEGKEFFFDGTAGEAWLKVLPVWGKTTPTILTHEFVDGHIHTATNRLPVEGHGLTDDGTGHTFVLSGASPVDEQYFEGQLAGALNFVWNPSDAAKAFRFARAVSPTTGALTVSNGVVRLTDGATFTGLSRLVIGPTATFEVAETAGEGLKVGSLMLAAGGHLAVGAGKTVRVPLLWQGGQNVPDGTYTAAEADWLTGAGTVVVDRYHGTYGENQIVLTVADGAAETLEEALTAYNAAEGTDYAFDDLNGGRLKDWTLVKRGAGTLRLVSTNENFVGAVHLEAGVADVVARYGLGTGAASAPPIYVHDGATLLCTHPQDSAAAAGTDFRNGDRIVHVVGAGVDGTGALKGTGGLIAYGTRPIFGSRIVLDGDALVRQGAWYTPAAILTLNGFTLTLKGDRAGECVHFSRVEGDGHLVLEGCQSRQQTVTFTGVGTVTFADAAGFRFWSSAGAQWPASGPWPFLFTGATTYLYGDMGVLREKGANTLTGPMRIDGTLTQSSQGNTDYSAVFLKGPVSGSGTVSVAKRYTENNILHLLNPANTFTGGAHVEGGILCVYGDGTLPPSGTLDIDGSYDLTRQGNPGQMCDFYGVQLLGVEACTLPPLRLRGTKDVARVQGGRGTWRLIVKEDANTVGYYSEAGAPLLEVREGTFKLPRGAAPGLWEGITLHANAAAAEAAVAGDACATNYVTRGPTSANQVPCDLPVASDARRLVTYTGYIWNRTGAAKTVTFAQSIGGRARLEVNGEAVIDAAGANTRTAAQAVLQPGANAFAFRAHNCAPYCTDAEEKAGTWSRYAGLVWDAEGRAPSSPLATNNFARLVDPGDGSLFTRSASPTENLPVFDAIRLGAAATLDINGTAYTAQDLSGGGTVLSSATDAEAVPSLTLRKLTVDVGARETLRVEVPVVFADGFTLAVTNAAAAKGAWTILAAAAPMADVPYLVVTGDDGRKWTAALSPDGRSLDLAHTGLTFILR